MTRDEAIEKARNAYAYAGGFCSGISVEASIAVYVALGMLKLDEPKTIYQKIDEALARFTDHSPPGNVMAAFDSVGLKIVEK